MDTSAAVGSQQIGGKRLRTNRIVTTLAFIATGAGLFLLAWICFLGILPLLWFTTRRSYLGPHAFGRLYSCVLWVIAACIVSGNLWLVYLTCR